MEIDLTNCGSAEEFENDSSILCSLSFLCQVGSYFLVTDVVDCLCGGYRQAMPMVDGAAIVILKLFLCY